VYVRCGCDEISGNFQKHCSAKKCVPSNTQLEGEEMERQIHKQAKAAFAWPFAAAAKQPLCFKSAL